MLSWPLIGMVSSSATAQVKAGGSAALGQRIAQNRRWRRFQTSIIVPIGGSAESSVEILSALRYQAAGRASVEAGNPPGR